MLISTKGRYALRVMSALAVSDAGRFIPLAEIAESQNISIKYLESIVTLLSKNGLVDAVRGKGGGYRLNRAADDYSIGEILKAAGENLAPVSCLENFPNKCDRAGICPTLPVWEKLDSMISDYLESVRLSDVLAQETGLKPDCYACNI